jgi:hypothetical protein
MAFTPALKGGALAKIRGRKITARLLSIRDFKFVLLL